MIDLQEILKQLGVELMDSKKISQWPVVDAFGLIEYLKEFKSIEKMYWDSNVCILKIRAKPGQGFIEAFKENTEFWENFWESSLKDGLHTFMVDPKKIGFKLVADFCKDNNMVRQNIYNSRFKFDMVYESPKKVWVRRKDKIEKP